MQPERDHHLHSEKSATGEAFGAKWRDAREGGFLEFDMKIDPKTDCVLVLTYWGGESGNRNFDILLDGKKIATQRLLNNEPNKFFDVTYDIPAGYGDGKSETVRVKLQAHPGAMAGGLFGARVMRVE